MGQVNVSPRKTTVGVFAHGIISARIIAKVVSVGSAKTMTTAHRESTALTEAAAPPLATTVGASARKTTSARIVVSVASARIAERTATVSQGSTAMIARSAKAKTPMVGVFARRRISVRAVGAVGASARRPAGDGDGDHEHAFDKMARSALAAGSWGGEGIPALSSVDAF